MHMQGIASQTFLDCPLAHQNASSLRAVCLLRVLHSSRALEQMNTWLADLFPLLTALHEAPQWEERMTDRSDPVLARGRGPLTPEESLVFQSGTPQVWSQREPLWSQHLWRMLHSHCNLKPSSGTSGWDCTGRDQTLGHAWA